MRLDLTKAKPIKPIVKCHEDGQMMSFNDCIRCESFVPMLKGELHCMCGIDDFKKQPAECYVCTTKQPAH